MEEGGCGGGVVGEGVGRTRSHYGLSVHGSHQGAGADSLQVTGGRVAGERFL